MNRFRLLALGFVTGFLLLALGAVFFIQIETASHTVSVWIIKTGAAVSLGTPYTPATVDRVSIKAQDSAFNYTQIDPGGGGNHFIKTMLPGDIVRDDDLAPDNRTVAIAVTGTASPDVTPGSNADVFAPLPGSATNALVLISPHGGIPVLSGSASSFTLLVSTDDEAAWVAISNAKTALVLVKTVPGQKVPASPIDVNAALCKLNALACS